MKNTIILLLKVGAITGNIFLVLWVSINALEEYLSGTIYQQIMFIGMTLLLATNSFLIIRSFKIETIHQS